MPLGELVNLKRKIARERGLDCDRFKKSFFLRRVAARMRYVGQPTIHAYSRFLDRDPREYARLFDALSINMTRFFRDHSPFRLIRHDLLPRLLAEKVAEGSRTVRVWSAGCATGQEPYSLAILLAEALERWPGRFMAHVYSTDIDRKAVASCATWS